MSTERAERAYEYVRKIKSYLDAERSADVKNAIGNMCSMQTIRNLVSGDIDAPKSTIFKNGILQKICAKLPDLRIESHYKAYQGFLQESQKETDQQRDVRSFEGSYDVFHNLSDSGIEFKRMMIKCRKDPFFPVFYLDVVTKQGTDRNDGFIFSTDEKIIMMGVSEKYIANMTFNKIPHKTFPFKKTLVTDELNAKRYEQRRIKCFRGTLSVSNVISGATYFSSAFFLQKDLDAKIDPKIVYDELDELSYYY